MTQRFRGKVKSFSVDSGYGFVIPAPGQGIAGDFFMHLKQSPDLGAVHGGMAVTFELGADRGRTAAANVRAADQKVDDDELSRLRRHAARLGYYCNVHRQHDVCRGGGEYYLMQQRSPQNPHPASVITYASASDIENELDAIERAMVGGGR